MEPIIEFPLEDDKEYITLEEVYDLMGLPMTLLERMYYRKMGWLIKKEEKSNENYNNV